MPKDSRRLARCAGLVAGAGWGGWVGRWPVPGCSGMAQALLKRRRGSGLVAVRECEP
jgi:hypothetical protein